MHTSLLASPRAESAWPASEAALRSSVRLGRLGLFTGETLTRLLLDGAATSLEERASELCWVSENLCALTGVRPWVHGTIPREPCVLVANHLSYLDPIVLASHVRCAPIAKAEVSGWPCVGEIARRVGAMFVKRECAHSGARVLRESLRALASGVSILVFPEGTTSPGDDVLAFQRGAFGLARLAGVPVVPVALQYADRASAWVGDETFLPHLARTVARPVTPMSVRFLPALDAEYARPEELAELARSQIERQLRRSDSSAPRSHVPAHVRAVA